MLLYINHELKVLKFAFSLPSIIEDLCLQRFFHRLAGGQGIDNKKGNVYIYGTDDSQFYIHSLNTSGKLTNQAAINNGTNGEIILTGGSINMVTDKVDKGYGDGITNSSGTTTLNFNGKLQVEFEQP